ncbi:hypothetical protein pb186bvf_000196 [Paramecium bursaria]
MGNACGDKNSVKVIQPVPAPAPRPQQEKRFEHPYKKSLQILSDNFLEDVIYNFGSSEAKEKYKKEA